MPVLLDVVEDAKLAGGAGGPETGPGDWEGVEKLGN
jgi:hypothetical protein